MAKKFNPDNEIHYKFWENSAPEEYDIAYTFKGFCESLEGMLQLAKVGKRKKISITVESITHKEYQEELKRKK